MQLCLATAYYPGTTSVTSPLSSESQMKSSSLSVANLTKYNGEISGFDIKSKLLGI